MKKLGKTIGAALVICVFVILLKNEYGGMLLTSANYGMPALIRESRQKTEGEGAVDLFVGSSMFGRGLDINELYGCLGGNEYLLTYDGNQPFLEYYEVAYLIDAGVDIGHVYIDMYAFSAARRPWLSDERLLLQTDLQFKKNIWNEMYQSSKAGAKDFWEMFVTSNNEAVFTWPVYQAMVNPSMFRGGNLRKIKGITAEKMRKMDMPDPTKGAMFSEQKEYLVKLIELCRSKEIPITFVETPKYTELLIGRDDYLSIMAEYIELLTEYRVPFYLSEATSRELEGTEKNGLDYDPQFIIPFDSTDAGMFSDYIHLSASEKKNYTKKLVEALKENR